ncbi:ribonuclease VapC [Halopolyspora algeriensis]|uniref:Ribonuclease VapC n=1 Tax=Halopolyspora algeriensis TaxID=1500506 RepID=A0A368VEA7_9ACTN|nr:type II toxin-antitoxin system VapC family toxin [Halopolyspora algeriensis]RCW39529.1 ribonuclease VapC [Halopolyspora algeriensis]TQM56158.1 ribonuclease VapC [Halopolyspora algeriensis]
MIIDSSAIVAILLKEDGHERLQERIVQASEVGVGAATVVETGIVLVARMGVRGKTLLARFLQEGGIEVVPMTQDHWWIAVDAYERFGKRRHPAGLNFGDCLTYATASVAGEPLLCTGDDFPETDLALA